MALTEAFVAVVPCAVGHFLKTCPDELLTGGPHGTQLKVTCVPTRWESVNGVHTWSIQCGVAADSDEVALFLCLNTCMHIWKYSETCACIHKHNRSEGVWEGKCPLQMVSLRKLKLYLKWTGGLHLLYFFSALCIFMIYSLLQSVVIV